MIRHRLVDGRLPLRLVGDVEMDVARLAAGLLDLGDDGLAFLVQKVGHDHGLGALAGKQAGGRGAHAACGAADQRDLVLHAHGGCSFLRRS